MTIENMMKKMKAHPDFSKAGMVLYHNGVVRESTREGDAVTGLSVKVDHDKLNEIIATQRAKPGIVEILVEIYEGKPLNVGDDVMFLAVAGYIRENVIAVLSETLNRIKSEATSKEQFLK